MSTSKAATKNNDGISLSVDRLIAVRDEVALSSGAGRQTTGLTRIPGQSRGRRHGTGVEFEDLRLYQHGDDIRHIDWNATARLGETYLKRYREERERLCIIIVDFRSSMAFGTGDRLKSVAAGELAAALCWLAAAQGYRVGAAIAGPGDRAEASRPRAAPQGTLDALGLIARQHSDLLERWREPASTLDAAMQIASHTLVKGGRAILVTGGADPGPVYDDVAEQLAAGQELLVYHLLDAIEDPDFKVPSGLYPFRSRSGTGQFSVSINRQKTFNKRRTESRQATIDRFGIHHTPVLTVSSTTPLNKAIAPLMNHDFL